MALRITKRGLEAIAVEDEAMAALEICTAKGAFHAQTPSN
jgi:hypothetical protein